MVLPLLWVFCTDLRKDGDICFINHQLSGFHKRSGKCLHGLIPYIKQIRLVFKRLMCVEIKLPRQFCEMLSSDSSVTGIVQIFGNSAKESNFIREEIIRADWAQGMPALIRFRISSYTVQNLISSSFLSKNVKIQWTIILPVVLYGCGTWSVTLREKQAEDVWWMGAEEGISV